MTIKYFLLYKLRGTNDQINLCIHLLEEMAECRGVVVYGPEYLLLDGD